MTKKSTTKINPFSLSRPLPKIVEKEFTDPSIPDQSITFKLKVLDQAELIQAYELSQHFADQYLGSEGNPPKMLFPVVDGQPVTMSNSLIQTASVIYCMQADKSEEVAYSVEDLIAMSVTLPKLWIDLSRFVNVELPKTGDDSKNA